MHEPEERMGDVSPEEPAPHVPRAYPLPTHGVWLTQVILALNVAVYLLVSFVDPQNFLTAFLLGADTTTLKSFGAKANDLIKAGDYWRLVTPLFLHIGIMHLLFNQIFLLHFGRQMETLFGTLRFFTIYLLAGMAGSLASFTFSWAISAGASGAIFGIVAALVVFFGQNRNALGELGKQQFRSLLMLLGLNLLLGAAIPGIDNYGHLGGLGGGILLGTLLAPVYRFEVLPEPPFGRVTESPRPVPTVVVGLAGFLLIMLGMFMAFPVAPISPF